jgi:hypothetical protein
MKLTTNQQRKVEEQLGIGAVPEEHPVTAELVRAFGEHTYFLVTAGLHVVEPDPSGEGDSGNVVKVASWASEARTELVAHPPEVLEVSVDLDPGEPDPAGA